MANNQYYNVMNARETWQPNITYKTYPVYDVTGKLIMVSCPTVVFANGLYVANGFTAQGVAKQPTLGLTPDSDTAWQIYTQGS